MSRWRQAFDRIGGPDAITWPGFWITYLLSLVGNLAAAGTVTASLGVRVLIVSVVQVAMFVPLVVLRFTLLRNPSRPRPWVAVAGFILAAPIRGVGLGVLFATFAPGSQPLFVFRSLASIAVVTLPLLAVAVFMSTMRAHTRSLEALIRIQGELVKTKSRILEDVTNRNEEALNRVQERLRAELIALDSVRGTDSVAELQRLATDVVRPMSHELTQSLPSRTIPESDIADARVTWREAAGQMIDRPPLQPLLGAVFMLLLMMNAALTVYGLARGFSLALAVSVSVAVLSIAGNWLLARALPLLGPRAVLFAVGLVCALVGFVTSAASSIFLPQTQDSVMYIVGGGVYVTLIVLLSTVVTTILRRQRATEDMLLGSTERLRRQLVRLRQAQWLQRQGLSRALHGPVQAAVTAAALRLDHAVRNGEAHTALLEDTRRSLRATVDVLEVVDANENSPAVALARITGTWEGVCRVTSYIDGCAEQRLADDPIADTVIVDVMTEAVSNAVRHGGARHADVSITCVDGDLVRLVVRDDGRGQAGSSMPGLGTTLLEECTLDWNRDVTPTGCVLTATLPTAASATAQRENQSEAPQV